MKTTMKYTIALLLLFVLDVGVAMAQSGGTPKAITKSQQTELDRLEKEVVKAEETFANESELKKLKDPAKSKIMKRHEDVRKSLEAIIELQQKQLADCQEELAIFRFFSNTEETIFADSTLEWNGWSKKLTGIFLTQYEVISKIHDVSVAISEVERTIDVKTEEARTDELNEEEKKNSIVYAIRKRIYDKIGPQIDEIEQMDYRFLSDKQKEYYKKLRGRFNDILQEYF
ncbi:MAG: hypothetical protein IKH61_00680 [Bacteroidales bacterium]|nr:hypothetical protein [Bacteroidales bacterium]